jgi:spermidine/putrescine transport system permease protein
MALAVLIVRSRPAGMDRSLVEASMDLYASPWGTFRQIRLPQLMCGVCRGRQGL